MTSLKQNLAVSALILTLVGCTQQQATRTTTTTKTTTTTQSKTVNLRIGMNGSEAVAMAGIPCSASTLKAINEGANVTVKHQGRAYVFSKGLLEAVR